VVRPDKVEGKLENLRGYVQQLTQLASLSLRETNLFHPPQLATA